ncbi:hypothetical protein HGRIS_010076 [Hohenbuehelia grisea]|uniref:Uncharacterized protein n=1 Tax=Hohenbuehelia grisea TaxID=104357 RepID=A0ABR3J3K5_9AGAR
MTSTIGEPFVLSNHSLAQYSEKSNKRGQEAPVENIYATFSKFHGDEFVTVTAQRDGLHVLDISTTNPTISHTLGPSTVFACPAVTRFTVDGSRHLCTTLAAIQTSPDIEASEAGKIIWAWREDLSSTVHDPASRQRKSIAVPHLVSRLYASTEPNCAALALSPQGDISLIHSDFTLDHLRNSTGSHSVLQSFVLPRQECSFLPSRTAPSQGVIVVSVSCAGSALHIQVTAMDEHFSIVELGNFPLSTTLTEFVSASLSGSGFLTIISQDGSWLSYSLESPNSERLELNLSADSLQLTSLSFISTKSPNTSSKEVAILSLGSSHVILAGITKSPSREVVLLLWDLQYGIVLALHSLPIPPHMSLSKEIAINMQLESAGSHVILALSPTPAGRDQKAKTGSTSSSLKSSLLVAPVTVPSTSTIANAMGRTELGAKWLASPSTTDSATIGIDSAHAKVLDSMRLAMEQNLPQAANEAFFGWQKAEQPPSQDKESKSQSVPVPLPYSFVRKLLAIILQPSKPANTAYSSEVLRYLLKRKAISSNMLKGNLLATLRLRGDWGSITSALKDVLDLTETELIVSLKCVVARCLQSSNVATESMDVDTSDVIPPLKRFLASCVCYRTTPSALRAAIREHLRTPEEVVCVLTVLEEWLRQWQDEDMPLDMASKAKQKSAELPPLADILSFLQSTLDSTFLLLLSDPQSHPVLHALSDHLDPEVAWGGQLESLRGALEPFAKAQRRSGKDGKKRGGEGDWKQRRKAQVEANMTVGMYRLEHLLL